MVSKKKKNSKAATLKNSTVCVFCKCNNLDEIKLGGLKSLKNMYAHYYCLLFSDSIQQSGQDNQGILGFMYTDIVNELRQSKDKQCSYCKEMNANVTCSNAICNRKYHLPCGLANNSQQNFNSFSSLCCTHRKVTNIPVYIKRSLNEYDCVICLERFDTHDNISNIIWANCCKSDIVFHLHCIQQLALNSGYFTKCPGCNNKTEFISTIKSLGVFVPERDASWELERDAFSELLYVHKTCDVTDCVCPEGRNFVTAKGQWKLVLCKLCGSFGTHITCTNIKRDFVCELCKVITEPKTVDIRAPDANAEMIKTRSHRYSDSIANLQEDLQEEVPENKNSTLQEKSLVANSEADSVIHSINNDPICSQYEKFCNAAVETDVDELSSTLSTSTHSVQDLKGIKENMTFDYPSTSQFFGTPISFSLKRKISSLESDHTEHVSYKKKKNSSPLHENVLEDIQSKENYTECGKFQNENSAPHFGEVTETQRKRVNSLTTVGRISETENIKNYNYNLENVNEEVYLIKKLSSISSKCDVARYDNSKISCEFKQELSPIESEINLTEYKILLDTNSEIEFITRPDINLTDKKKYSDVKSKTKNIDAIPDLSLNGAVNNTKIITDEKENSCTSDNENKEETAESTSDISQNNSGTNNSVLDEITHLEQTHPAEKKPNRIIKINFRNRTVRRRFRSSRVFYKWNFPFLKSL